MISAYASANTLVLGQLKAEQKSNEITAIPTLLKMLYLRGASDNRCYGLSMDYH